ncbi:MAG: MmgE/PrpD family protein [Acidimicrobiaceae bacterium]|nr:MmgE/PrpD family protein [Acidimicrobiaceae bacterium]MYL04337.1 MmgE/PrpD family protein [Acidimicrobiaceae bacterium]
MNRTRQLAEAVAGISFDALGEPEIEAVRRLLLDHIGVAAAGSVTDSAAAFRRTMGRFAHDESAALPVIGAGGTAAAVPAAMANAVAGHSIEYDDVHNSSSSHPGVVMYPAAMAATALAGGDERDLVRSVVIGFEVMCRAGRAADPAAHYARHFHPTGTIGALGAAAAAAAALGLDAAGFNSAIGIAATMASGSMEFLRDGAWTKRLHPALAARNGVEAGLLAADGYVGTDDGICGERGFLAAYSDAPEPERLMEGWGQWPLEVVSTSIKRHTCCRYNQGAIDALLAIRSAHGLGADDVESVVIGIPSIAVDIVAEPAASKRRPASVVDAQFSLAFGAAAALLWGRAGLSEYDEARLDDPAALALMDRVTYEVDPAIDRDFPDKWRAWARVTTTGGDTHTQRVDDPKGDPGNPFTDDECREKFDDLASAVYSTEARAGIAEHALSIGAPGSWKALQDSLT